MMKNTSLLLLLFLLINSNIKAQTIDNDLQYRTKIEFGFKPMKDVKLKLTTDFRFGENIQLDKYLFETELTYKPLKFLDVDATYRFIVNPISDGSTEYYNRFAISSTAKKEFGRLESAFRLKYSNYADDEIIKDEFIRYKFSLKYDIKDVKISPFISTEAFQQIDDGKLYKMRYTAGMDYKLFKKNFLSLNYKFDFYINEYKNKHIISLGYKIKF